MSRPNLAPAAALFLIAALHLTACANPMTVGYIDDLAKPPADAGLDAQQSCPDAPWGQFTIFGITDSHFGPPGCSTDSSTPRLVVAAVINDCAGADSVGMDIHVKREDDSVFPVGLLTLYVGGGPECAGPVVNNVKVGPILKPAGQTQHELCLSLNPYTPSGPLGWPLYTMKEFWVGFGDPDSPPFSASPTFQVQRWCAPPE